jgi:hypothetical protein
MSTHAARYGLRRPPSLGGRRSRQALRIAGAAAFVILAALVAGALVAGAPFLGLVVPGLAVGSLVCLRYPAASLMAAFLLTGAYGTIDAFTAIPVGGAIDFVIASLVLGVLGTFVVNRPDRTPRVWAGTAAVVLYAAIAAVGVVLASDRVAGVYSFRSSVWYLLALLLIAYAPWRAEAHQRVARGFLAVALAVGAYAVFRLIVGPADQERALALASSSTNLIDLRDPDIGLVGSFSSRHELAAWCAVAVPFAFALSLALRGRWRILSVAAAVACAMALLGSEVRVALAACLAGVLLVLVLYQLSRAFPGLHLGTTALVVLGLTAGGVAAFTWTVGDSPRSVERYKALFNPTQDIAYQDREIKWKQVVDDVDRHPFGHGMGSAGRAQQEHGRFVDVATFGIDNAYLKVAFEQGWGAMLLFAAATLLLLGGLVRRAVTTVDRARAGPALGACGALISLLVLSFAGVYIEGLPALAAWMLVGVGVAQFAWVESGR